MFQFKVEDVKLDEIDVKQDVTDVNLDVVADNQRPIFVFEWFRTTPYFIFELVAFYF
jgi:hypothetical protein